MKQLKKENEVLSGKLNDLVKTNFENENQILYKFEQINYSVISFLELKSGVNGDEKMNAIMGKQLKMFKKRVEEKDSELKSSVESRLRENQIIKDEIASLK